MREREGDREIFEYNILLYCYNSKKRVTAAVFSVFFLIARVFGFLWLLIIFLACTAMTCTRRHRRRRAYSFRKVRALHLYTSCAPSPTRWLYRLWINNAYTMDPIPRVQLNYHLYIPSNLYISLFLSSNFIT